MRHLDLFSGIGGFALGLNRAGFETVAFCEIDLFCQRVLKKHWPEVPIIEDVKDAEKFDAIGEVDIITGGYPCQPFSAAGLRRGHNDDRHLWPAMFEIIKRKRPAWVIGENVAGHISMGLDEVLTDLEAEGYQARAFVIPACAVNAAHRRDRLWIIANANDSGLQGICEKEIQGVQLLQGELAGSIEAIGIKPSANEPFVSGVTHGFPGRVDRVKSLGNAVVPQIPEIIGKAIMQIERQA